MNADTLRDYIRAGLLLVPIKAGTKQPHGKGWNRRARCWASPADVPDGYNGSIGLAHAYAGTCALDVDHAELAGPALASYGIDFAALLAAPDAVHILSGRPGRDKLLYRLRAPLASINRSAADGFELRCADKGGLTVQDVLPPSVHPDTGKPYQWRGDWHALPDIPDALLTAWRAMLQPRADDAPVAHDATVTRLPTAHKRRALPAVIAEGERNTTLLSLAAGLVRQGFDVQAVNDRLQRINAERCTPPLDADEVDAIAMRAIGYGSRGFRCLTDALFDDLSRSGLPLPACWMMLTALRRFDGSNNGNIALTWADCHDIPGCHDRKAFGRYRRLLAGRFLTVAKQPAMTRDGKTPTLYAIPTRYLLPSLGGQNTPIAHGGQNTLTYVDRQVGRKKRSWGGAAQTSQRGTTR